MPKLKVAQNPSARFQAFTRTRFTIPWNLNFLRNGPRVAHISTSEIPKADIRTHARTRSLFYLSFPFSCRFAPSTIPPRSPLFLGADRLMVGSWWNYRHEPAPRTGRISLWRWGNGIGVGEGFLKSRLIKREVKININERTILKWIEDRKEFSSWKIYNMYLNSIITKLQVERNGIKVTSLQPETKQRFSRVWSEKNCEFSRFKSPPFKSPASPAYCEQCREMAACVLARGRDSSPLCVCSFHALEKREVPRWRWARRGQNEKGESERKCALLKFRKSIGDDASGAIDAASWI